MSVQGLAWRTRATLALFVLVAAVAWGVAPTPAHAAVPDAHGIAMWVDTPPLPPNAPPSYKWPANTTINPAGPPGVYRVIFPGQAAKGGVAHVTAVHGQPHWCQVLKFGPVLPAGVDEEVDVACYRIGGGPDTSSFTVLYSSSSGPAGGGGTDYYANVDSDATGTMVSDYNSAASGPGNFVVKDAVLKGVYYVRLPGLKTPGANDGGLQVTAVNSTTPARCKATDWQSKLGYGQVLTVLCFDALGGPLDSGWALSYQYVRTLYGGPASPNNFGYFFSPPSPALLGTNFNSILGAGANTQLGAGGGLFLVTFPAIALVPDNVQVTAYGPGSEFCGLNVAWARIGHDVKVRDVNCFDTFGNPVNTRFLISYNAAS
jgi:hypothetical protein